MIEFILDKWTAPKTRCSDVEEPQDAIKELTEKEKYVLRALCRNTGGAVRRDVHADVCEIPGSPFANPPSNGKDRSEVGSILGRLRNVGLPDQNNYT